MNIREIFLKHISATSPFPMMFEIGKAQGTLLWDIKGKEYIDLIGGISVANTGHRHPKVISAIKNQLDNYLHVMVYGEYISTPQCKYAEKITSLLPSKLQSVYFTNSGAEAIEGSMKLAKRVTNRTKMIAFNQAYHGSTQGALSLIGSEYWRQAYRPLLPDIYHGNFNDANIINEIDKNTACIILEVIQGEAGVVAPILDQAWGRQSGRRSYYS